MGQTASGILIGAAIGVGALAAVAGGTALLQAAERAGLARTDAETDRADQAAGRAESAAWLAREREALRWTKLTLVTQPLGSRFHVTWTGYDGERQDEFGNEPAELLVPRGVRVRLTLKHKGFLEHGSDLLADADATVAPQLTRDCGGCCGWREPGDDF